MADESSNQSIYNYSSFGEFERDEVSSQSIDFYHQTPETVQKARSFTGQDLDKDIPVDTQMVDEAESQ